MLYNELIDKVYEAYYDCRRNKGRKASAIHFSWDYEQEVRKLTKELVNGTYKPSTSIVFGVTRPKNREVFAADFRDRIVHHLLMLEFGEIIDKEMIDDSYNCRKGKGVFYGQDRLEEEIKRISENYTKQCYVLSGDIEGFFMSIDKEKLCQMVERLIRDHYKDEDMEWWIRLFKQVLMHRPELDCEIHGDKGILDRLPDNKTLFRSNGKGLPIGNLPSQICGNLYRTPFDRMMQREIGDKGFYCVFVDDFRVVSRDKKLLQEIAIKARRYLKDYLGLTMHKKKFSIDEAKKGVKFIGCVIRPWGRYVSNRLINNALFVFAEKEEDMERQMLRMNSYMGFLIHTKTYGIRWNLYKNIPKEARARMVCVNMRKYQMRDSFDNTLLTAS